MNRPNCLASSIVRAAGCALLLTVGCTHATVFHSDVETAAKPWTHMNFRNDPDAFQFAIVSDRTGGARPGVFESAIPKLNLLQPEFVVCVGDLIEGYTEDRAVLNRQWDEISGFVAGLEMPFFYTPGNHDNINPTMKEIYRERFGRMFYSFTYKNALFMILDTQESNPGLSSNQVAWAVETLRRNPDVRWTILLMHQPLWVHEEGNFVTARKNIGKAHATGFGEVERALDGRPYTVIAGHFHQYVKFVRRDRSYIILGTTGGASQMRGPAFGEFDHAVWVTLTTNGPVLANLMLDGIRSDDIYTEAHVRFQNTLRLRTPETFDARAGFTLSLPLENPFGHMLHAELSWDLPAGWTVTPATAKADVATGQTNTLTFAVHYAGTNLWPALPHCEARVAAGDAYSLVAPTILTLNNEAMLRAFRPTTEAPRAAAAPRIDGLIDEPAWQAATSVRDFRHSAGQQPGYATEARVCYDATALYFAFRCAETNMAGVLATVVEHDGGVYTNDAVEVLLGAPALGKSYVQLAVNSAGVLYDGKALDKTYTSHAQTAAARDAEGWTVEIALPWESLGGKPQEGTIPMLLGRDRPQSRDFVQYPPLNSGHHRPEMFGWLKLRP